MNYTINKSYVALKCHHINVCLNNMVFLYYVHDFHYQNVMLKCGKTDRKTHAILINYA